MFKKSQRLSEREFGAYFKAGKRVHTPHFTFITAPAPSRKVAVVVSKKVAKHAVRRNALRRQVYAILRAALQDVAPEVLIVIVKPPVQTLPRKQLAAVLRQAIAELYKSA